MRSPQDKLSQRVLVYELKHAIDRCVRKPWDTIARRHLAVLIDDNPRSVRSTHVLHNIGRARREFLLGLGARGRAPLPSAHDPHSLETSDVR